MPPFEILDKSIKSEEILSRVNKHLAENMKNKEYENDPFLEAEEKINNQGDNFDTLDGSYEKICRNCDPWTFVQITSHRAKTGEYIVFVKKIIRKLIHPFTKLILGKQREFNIQLSTFLGNFLTDFRQQAVYEEEKRELLIERLKNEIINKAVEDQNGVINRSIEEQRNENRVLEERMRGLQRAFDSLESAYYSITKDLAEAMSTRVSKGDLQNEDVKAVNSLISRAKSHFLYHRFNEQFSGDIESEKKLYIPYIKYFKNCKNVLDLGCGRAPFLRLLHENGIPGTGIDSNASMVAKVRKEGFSIEHKDALEYLMNIENSSVDGVFMGHLVEHLKLEELITLLRYSHMKLDTGGRFIFETPNTGSLFVLSNVYFKDGTHQLPRHPDFYRFLVEDIGFRDIELKYSYRVPMEEKLTFLPPAETPGGGKAEEKEHGIHNENINFLRDFLFNGTNVAIIARK